MHRCLLLRLIFASVERVKAENGLPGLTITIHFQSYRMDKMALGVFSDF